MTRLGVTVGVVLAGWLWVGGLYAEEQPNRVYELRIYQAAPGKFEAMEGRIRDHGLELFKKHGMTSIGYWVPLENPNGLLYYILAFPSKEAKDQAWKAFFADPEWKEVAKKTEAGGKVVAKVQSILLQATDYSPPIKPEAKGGRIFEFRYYTASPGNLGNLNSRFRNHTLELFKKHGITNIAYWVPLKGQKGVEENMLYYFVAHKDLDTAKASWEAFRTDPDWVKARKASEEKAGGSLTAKDGVKSIYMKALDFSPLR